MCKFIPSQKQSNIKLFEHLNNKVKYIYCCFLTLFPNLGKMAFYAPLVGQWLSSWWLPVAHYIHRDTPTSTSSKCLGTALHHSSIYSFILKQNSDQGEPALLTRIIIANTLRGRSTKANQTPSSLWMCGIFALDYWQLIHSFIWVKTT